MLYQWRELMQISGITSYSLNSYAKSKTNFQGKEAKYPLREKSVKLFEIIDGEGKTSEKNKILSVENISDDKVGQKYLIRFNDEKYKGLTILFKPDSIIEQNYSASSPNFTGKVYGSIRQNNDGSVDTKMENAYNDFWNNGFIDIINKEFNTAATAKTIKDDYNFYVPSDGDGTRYRDITKLQGGVTKPASEIPAVMNGKNMKLVQVVLTNFAKTGKLTEEPEFIHIEPAKGSAYAFLEGLKNGQISTDKPIVFSWGDNFSDLNITSLIKNHEANNAFATLVVLPTNLEGVLDLGATKVKANDNLEITKFMEKPSPEEAQEFKVKGTEDSYLGAIGPYILSSEALKWIKENYTKTPEIFKDPKKGYDFSKMIVGNIVNAINNGEIENQDGQTARIFAYKKPENETWSDLGKEKDFTAAMKSFKLGNYAYLPRQMKTSILNNVDKNGNITFDKKAKELLEAAKKEYNLTIKNCVVHYNTKNDAA